jgi:GTP-binding protein
VPKDPLPIQSVAFMGALAEAGGWRPPADVPEIAFVGRSNVGKSSLLNRLVRHRAVARVSRTPGRTRTINFFRVNDAFTLVDLPGYGYARVAKEQRAGWQPLIEGYFAGTADIRGAVLLLDARRDPSDEDRQMLDYLVTLGVPVLVVVTKIDKLSRAAADERVRVLGQELGIDADQVIAFSARTGDGRDALAEAVASALAVR